MQARKIANPNSSAGLGSYIVEKARSAALYINPQPEASRIAKEHRVG